MAINNAKRQWKNMHGAMTSNCQRHVKEIDLHANHLGFIPTACDVYNNSNHHYDEGTQPVSSSRSISMFIYCYPRLYVCVQFKSIGNLG